MSVVPKSEFPRSAVKDRGVYVDEGIADDIRALRRAGIPTWTSCQTGWPSTERGPAWITLIRASDAERAIEVLGGRYRVRHIDPDQQTLFSQASIEAVS